MKKFHFPGLEILIVILVGTLIWLLGNPQYKAKEKINKRYLVRVNMYTLRMAIENYAAYNDGKFPKSLEDFKKFYIPPVNPYQGKSIIPEDITLFQYTSKKGPENQSPNSENGKIHGSPGGLAYGYFIPEEETLSSDYGILGFDDKGVPLAEKLPSGETEIFVLYE